MSYNQGRVAMVDHQSEVKQWEVPSDCDTTDLKHQMHQLSSGKSLVTVTPIASNASVKGWRPFCVGPRTVGPLLKLEAKENINVLKLSVIKSFTKNFKIWKKFSSLTNEQYSGTYIHKKDLEEGWGLGSFQIWPWKLVYFLFFLILYI